MELRWNGDGDLHVAQPSYIAELIKRHNVECARPVPFSKPEIPENPQMTPEAIRAAQGLVGELLWLSVRTRPDVSFGVLVRHEGNGPEVRVLQGRPRARWRFTVCEVDEEIRDVRRHLLCPAG